MNKKSIVLFLSLLSLPVLANTAAPMLMVTSGNGVIFLPLIILIEWAFYHYKAINNPFKLSLWSNLFSGFVGAILFSILSFTALPFKFETAANIRFWQEERGFPPKSSQELMMLALLPIFFLLLNWLLSAFLEYKFASWLKTWKEKGLPLKLFLQASGLTYALIIAWFFYSASLPLLRMN